MVALLALCTAGLAMLNHSALHLSCYSQAAAALLVLRKGHVTWVRQTFEGLRSQGLGVAFQALLRRGIAALAQCLACLSRATRTSLRCFKSLSRTTRFRTRTPSLPRIHQFTVKPLTTVASTVLDAWDAASVGNALERSLGGVRNPQRQDK